MPNTLPPIVALRPDGSVLMVLPDPLPCPKCGRAAAFVVVRALDHLCACCDEEVHRAPESP